jgi:hypothetical protein
MPAAAVNMEIDKTGGEVEAPAWYVPGIAGRRRIHSPGLKNNAVVLKQKAAGYYTVV